MNRVYNAVIQVRVSTGGMVGYRPTSTECSPIPPADAGFGNGQGWI